MCVHSATRHNIHMYPSKFLHRGCAFSDTNWQRYLFSSYLIIIWLSIWCYQWWNRELTLKSKLKRYVKPMKDPLGISPSKENQGTTRGKEKILLTSVGIEPTTSGLDLPLLCRLSFEVSRTEKVGDDLGGESRQRESIYTFIWCHLLANLHIGETWISLERKEIFENSNCTQHFSSHTDYLLLF